MKNTIYTILLTFAFISCSVNKNLNKNSEDYSQLSLTELNRKNESLIQMYNNKVSLLYYNHLKAENKTPKLGKFGWDEVKEYWINIPELGALRDDFIRVREEVLEFEKANDENYRIAYELYEKKQISQKDFYERTKLTKQKVKAINPAEHERLRNNYNETLGKSNRETFKYIISDYNEKEKTISIDWIPVEDIKKNRFIKKLSIELDRIENEIIKRQ